MDARLAQYEQRAQEEEDDDQEEEEEKMPDLQKDDMMARRTGVFYKQNGTAAVAANHFLPLPASQRCTRGEAVTDAATASKKEVQAERSKVLNVRWAAISN